MKTPRALYVTNTVMCNCELVSCPVCGASLVACQYVTGRKTVQTMAGVLSIAQRPKRCEDPRCPGYSMAWRSAQWQQIAPWYGTYGYDVIAQIGWERQDRHKIFADIHSALESQLQISESQVRRLYHYVYLPLLACHERQDRDRLEAKAREVGLILTLDGLAPEGGEPQLWVVRELQTGVTLRCGWLSQEDEPTFVNFLAPIRETGWRVVAILSDKQRGLVPAVAAVFPGIKHAFCQMHYLKNAAAPIAKADEEMKVTLRKSVRRAVGGLIRSEKASETPGVLTVTGLLPSPVLVSEAAARAEEEAVPAPNPAPTPAPPGQSAEGVQPTRPTMDDPEREAIVQDLLRRVRYLLTLKGRPPFRLAGIEVFEGLTAVADCVSDMLQHDPEPRLVQLQGGLRSALDAIRSDYTPVRQAANWLEGIAKILDPEGKPARSGEQVRQELWTRLEQIKDESADSLRLQEFGAAIRRTSVSYDSGLFHTYDVPGLPRTNNERESEFRDLTRRLLSTTGQKGLVRRTIQREGAWELIPSPPQLKDVIKALSQVDHQTLYEEQQRVRVHRGRFRLHVRSSKQSTVQLARLQRRWTALTPARGP